MNDPDKTIFKNLFREAYRKCFGVPLTSFLSETDSKLLSNRIFEATGLVIGAKSIKNYSFFVLNSKDSHNENPSVATLDTLARYVLDAPYTDEIKRKDREGHFPYWFQYRTRFFKAPVKSSLNVKMIVGACFLILIIVFGFVLIKSITKSNNKHVVFKDNFNSLAADSLKSRGWIIKSADSAWWNKRDEISGHLALYTLKGDNWADNENPAMIKNLLTRRIRSDCFMVETHITNFIPVENWQQAGILLSEDSTLTGKMIRLSISYNDFFGGYKKPPEIIIQALSSSESGLQSKPEEIGHLVLFTMNDKQDLVKSNLASSALKIEKKGNHFRFLYAAGSTEVFAFKEAVSGDFDIEPRYVAIFSIQGWSKNQNQIPAYFDSFTSVGVPCSK